MATISPSLSTRTDSRGKAEILLRFVGGRDHIFRLHSRLFVSPSRWKDGSIIVPRLETQEQQELKQLRKRLEDLCFFLVDEFQKADPLDLSKEWMQDAVDRFHHPDRKDRRDLFQMFAEFRTAKDVSPARMKRYDVTIRALDRFQQYRGRPLTIEGMTAETLEEFRSFLQDEHRLAVLKKYQYIYREMDKTPEERSRNAVVEYMKVLRAFFHWLQRQGVTENNPFGTFEIGSSVYGTPYYITIEERDRIFRTNLDRHPSLAIQRDIFVFQCLVGCRVGDLVKFRKGDVVDGVLTYIPRKTIDGRPVLVRVPLNETAMEIVIRYRDNREDKLLPVISVQKYNDAIKRIFLAARITRPVAILDPLTRKEVKRPLNEVASSHLARRTFIGNLYKQVQDPNLISAMSGHTDGSKAFARYRDIDDDLKAEVIKKLDKS